MAVARHLLGQTVQLPRKLVRIGCRAGRRQLAHQPVDARIQPQVQPRNLLVLFLELPVALLPQRRIDQQQDEQHQQQCLGQRQPQHQPAAIAHRVVCAAHQLTFRTIVFARSPSAE